MTAHAVSPTPPNVNPEYEEDNDEDLAARETEAFLANLAYTVQNENADGYLSPDDGPVHMTANTAFGPQCSIASVYLPPDDGSFQATFELDEFLSNLEFCSTDEQHTGYLSPDTEPVQITAHMMSGDDLPILPTDTTELPLSPDGKDLPRDRQPPNFFHALLQRTKDQKQAVEIPLSYAHVFEADIITAAEINRHIRSPHLPIWIHSRRTPRQHQADAPNHQKRRGNGRLSTPKHSPGTPRSAYSHGLARPSVGVQR